MKFVTNEKPEVYQDEGDEGAAIEGLSLVYRQSVKRAGRPVLFEQDSFAPNAFTNDTVALFNHDSNFPIGRESRGTLEVNETPEGLTYNIDLPDSPMGKNVAEAVSRGDVEGSSAEIKTLEDRVETLDGTETRVIEKYGIAELGPVTFPAFDQSEASISMSEYRRNGNGICEPCGERFGEELGSLMQSWIEEIRNQQSEDDRIDVTEAYEQLGEAAGISGSTVSSIVSGEIGCPPIERLEGFAGWFADNLTGSQSEKMADLLSAARNDGCEYDTEMAASRKVDASIRKLSRAIVTGNVKVVKDQLKRLNSQYFCGNLTVEQAQERIDELTK